MLGYRVIPREDRFNFTEVDQLIAGLRDYDGNRYQTVIIGSQEWITSNLKVTSYSDGTPIANITDNTEWAALATGAYCAYDNDDDYITDYGLLYNHFVVDDIVYMAYNGVQQVGWRIPTVADIVALGTTLGSPLLSRGGKLKETGTDHWQSPNALATNSTGFTAVGSGMRMMGGLFISLKQYAYFYMEELDATKAYSMYLNCNVGSLNYTTGDKNYGLSIRLVRDI